MFLIGLTGSIGMGKSTTAALFRGQGVPTWDADGAVHALYRAEAAPLVEDLFPGVVRNNEVERTALRTALAGRADRLEALERIIHPLLAVRRQQFLAAMQAERRPLALVDVPLLFETQGHRRCDAVVVVSAPAAVQRQRVLSRPGMTVELFAQLLARQWPDARKRAHAHFMVDSSLGLAHAQGQVCAIIAALAGRHGSRHLANFS